MVKNRHPSRRQAQGKGTKVAAFLTVAAVIALFAGLLYYSFAVVDHVAIIPMDVQVGSHVGLNADNDSLHFGLIPPPGAGHRMIVLHNDRPFALGVSIHVEGPIAAWSRVSNRSFVLGEGESKDVGFVVSIAKGTAEGNYTGYARIVFKRGWSGNSG